jgi:membrane-associated protease RseP (regulator of RpoE activity)
MRGGIVGALGLVLAVGAGAAGVGAARGDRTDGETRGDQSARRVAAGDAKRPHIVRRVEVRRGEVGGYLGVTLAEVERGDVARLRLEAERGARVLEVLDDTPAARAGLKADDVIVAYEGEPVRSALQLRRLVGETPAGRAVEIELVRDGGSQRVSVELAQTGRRPLGPHGFHFELPEPGELHEGGELSEPGELTEPGDLAEAPALRWHDQDSLLLRDLPPFAGWAQPRRLGLSYQEISGQLARYFKLEDERGVLVVEVTDDGPAARGGVKAGDVIVGCGGRPVASGSDLRAALRDTRAGQEVAVKVWRGGKPLELKVKLGGDEPRPGPGATT